MKILVACEESQAVTTELRKLGHEAYSCDIIECSGGHPEWHIMQDVLPLLKPGFINRADDMPASLGYEFFTQDGKLHFVCGRWDMIIAFPPCTHLAVSGARHFEGKRQDGRQREAIEFFCQFLTADCDRIAVENPINIISGDYCQKWFPEIAEQYGLPCKPAQIIQPWQFGHGETKATCLWLRGLPKLEPTDIVEGREQRIWKMPPSTDRAKNRSKTFPGIAKAMAEQWAGPNKDAGVWIDWPSCEYICSKCGRSADCVETFPTCPNCGSIMRTNEVYPNFDCFAEENGAPAWWREAAR